MGEGWGCGQAMGGAALSNVGFYEQPSHPLQAQPDAGDVPSGAALLTGSLLCQLAKHACSGWVAKTDRWERCLTVAPVPCCLLCCPQASPNDPDNFPFVVLGNKIDVEGGKSRQVRRGSGEAARGWGLAVKAKGRAGVWQ